MNVNGIAHFQLTVADLDASRAWWAPLFALFEMKVILDVPGYFYAIGGKTGVALSKHAETPEGDRFQQSRVGLHHLCFRLRSREDVDTLHTYMAERGAHVVHAPEDGPWAPGYYSVLFEDPDGIRVEANFVPGRGHLAAESPGIQAGNGLG